jgi:hypothetical protein
MRADPGICVLDSRIGWLYNGNEDPEIKYGIIYPLFTNWIGNCGRMEPSERGSVNGIG